MNTKISKTKPGSPEREKISQLVFAGMRDGLSGFKACETAGVNHSTFMAWMRDDADLANRYAHAREDLIERMANEILQLSDSEVPDTGDGKRDWQAIQQRRLQVDSRKWLLSKLAPKKYGDKLELTGDADNPLVIQKIERVIVNAKD